MESLKSVIGWLVFVVELPCSREYIAHKFKKVEMLMNRRGKKSAKLMIDKADGNVQKMKLL